MSDNLNAKTFLSAEQQALNDLWEEHVRDEFVVRDTDATLCTMVPDAYVNHIPEMTGGIGYSELREFYSRRFIPKMPPDTEIIPVSRTIGTERLVDEMIFRFTHTMEMDWMLPGVPPTGRCVEIPLVAIVIFAKERWRTSTFTGTRPLSWCNSGYLTPPVCRSRARKQRERF